MRKLRTKMRLFLWFAIIIFVGFIFLQWGMQITSKQRTSPFERGVVGKINGKPLSSRAYLNLVNRFREQGIEPGKCRELAFNALVEDALLREVFEQRGLELSDEEVVEIIKNNPPRELLEDTLLQTNGKFDYEKYLSLISDPRNIGWLRYYESVIRSQVPRQLLYQDITSAVRPTTIDLLEAYIQQKIRLELEYVFIDPNTFSANVDSLKAYYDTHREDFRFPEQPVISYVRFPVSLTPDDEAEAKDVAQEIFELAQQGESLDSLAVRYRCTISKTEHPIKGIQGPQKDEAGYHILKEDQDLFIPIRPSDETLAKVDEQVRAFIDFAKTDGFNEAVQTYNLEVKKGQGKTIEGVDVSFINLERPDKLIGPIEGDLCFYILYTLGVQPSHIPNFSEAEEEVRNKYRKERAQEESQRLLVKIKEKSFRNVLSSEPGRVIKRTFFTLGDSSEGEDFFIQALNIPEDEVAIAVTDQGFYLVHCLKRFEPSQDEMRDGLAEFQVEWTREEAQNVYTDWFDNLKQNAKIEDYRYETR